MVRDEDEKVRETVLAFRSHARLRPTLISPWVVWRVTDWEQKIRLRQRILMQKATDHGRDGSG